MPHEAILILYLAGTGMTAKPLRVAFPSMEVCQMNAERERARGHKARCWQPFRLGPCANCGAPVGSIG